jgi:DNA polymerase-1
MAVDVKILQDIGKALDVTIADARKAFSTSAPDISVDRKRQGEVYTEIIKSEDINLNSPAQLSGLFYGELGCKSVRTKACTSTDREHLQAWADDGVELAKHILEFRSASTIRQTFIGAPGGKGLLAHVTDGDTRCKFAIYTQLNQTGTVTGRLSSRQPNLQNIPARREKDKHRMRRAFVARDGHQLIVADYSGAELRVMAHLSKDPEMLKALREGKDLHSITAKRVWNLSCEVEEVKTLHPDIRNHAKAINFGLQYGMSAGVLADQIGVTKEEAQDYIDKYFDFYSGVYRWMSAMVEKCRSKGYVTTLLGRRRRIPDINLSGDDNFGRRKHCENQAMNAPIQGGVADIIKIAMNEISLDPYMQGHEARLIMQVHDELIVECPEIDAYGVRDRVKELMEGAVKLRVPMIVDAAIGSNWEDAKA